MELSLSSELDNRPMTFDEASMERSKSFVTALQELKNLRPQLYSAAEYCEKSYLHSEQKQMVLDNLKDYAVRALVNAVDHLGTVAYKLTDLVDQQNKDVSAMGLKLSCIDQKLLTCRTYADNEGLRQQVLLAVIPRHHKHYTLPNSASKKVHFSPVIHTDARHTYFQADSRLQPSDGPASQTLSWHLASGTKGNLKRTANSAAARTDDPKAVGKNSEVFQMFDNDDSFKTKLSATPGPTSMKHMQTYNVNHKDVYDGSKPIKALGSHDNQRREKANPPARSKSMLSAFFVKQKTPKLKT